MPYFHCNSTPLMAGSVIKPGNWGRIIKHFGWTHNLAFRETVFEDIRAREFVDKPSRLDCAFFFDSPETVDLYRRMDPARFGTMIAYEVELLDPGAPQHRADWRSATDPQGPLGLDWIRDYWRGVMRPAIDGVECREVLARTSMRIVQQVS
jgi:hypothetical protein